MYKMRVFIGIDFDKALKDQIFEFQQSLKKYAVKGRWKYVDNFHLTLKFLDEINLTQQQQIDSVMKKISLEHNPFSLGVGDLGKFDGKTSIRVLWMGLNGDTKELQALHENIDEALAVEGFLQEKRSFKPHVTIGQDISLKYPFEEIQRDFNKVKFTSFGVNSIYLYKSEQIQNKRIYTKVAEYKLL